LNPKVIIFADLDGTLIDDKYDYSIVQPIINQLLSIDASIVINSSKTKQEIEYYRQELKIKDPFIVENGSAILIPTQYFKTKINFTKQDQEYQTIELGIDYVTLRKKMALIAAKTNTAIVGFGDMTIQQIAADTGLPLDLASFSKNRQYDEAFKIQSCNQSEFLQAIEKVGLRYTKGGRYFHVLGNTDKGKATETLKQHYLREFKKIITVGVGDSLNDFPMFQAVDKHFLINDKKPARAVWAEILEFCLSLRK